MSTFREVRDEKTGRLLFTFDPEADIIRVRFKDRFRGQTEHVEVEVDLAKYRQDEAGRDGPRKVS